MKSGGVGVAGGTGSEGGNGATGAVETGGGGGGFTADGSSKNGGAGQTSDITGEPLGYAGGGGGGVRNNGKTAGVGKDGGGTGGGAVGDASAQYTLATAGVRGGGGGGGGVKNDDDGTAKWKFGAKGGDGVVVIRYATSGDEPTPKGRTISNVSFASGEVSFNLGAAENDVALWVAGGASDRGESFDAWKTAGEAKFVRIVAKGGDVSGESVNLATYELSNAKVLRLFTRPAYDATLTGLVGSRSAAGVGSYIDTLDTPKLTDRLVADVTASHLSGGGRETIFSARKDNASGDRTMTAFIMHNQNDSTFLINYGVYNGTSPYSKESTAFTAAGARYEVTLNANKASVTPNLLAETPVKSEAETADAGGTLLLFATRAQTASGVIANHLGKFTLHSFKWYAEDGTLKHDYVPVRGAGDVGKKTVYDAKEGKLLTVTKAGDAGDFGGEVATDVTGSLTHSDVIKVTPAQANDWTTRPSISPSTWALGGTPGTLNFGAAKSLGTVTCNYTQTQVNSFEAGTHTVTFTVAHVDGWTDLDPVNINVTVTGGVVTDKDGWVNPNGGDWATAYNWNGGNVPNSATALALFNASAGGYGSIWPITVTNTADRTLKWLSAAQNANVTIDFDGNTLTANGSTSSPIGSPAENINGGDCLVVSNSTVTLRNGTYNFKTFEMVGPSGSRPELIADGSGTAVKFYGKPDKNLSTALNLATYGGDSAATFHRFITARNGAKIIFDAGASASTMAHLAGGNWTSSAPMNRNEFHMTVDGEGSLIRFGELSGQGNAPNFITVLNNGILEADRKLQAYQQQIDLTLDTKGQLKVGTDPNGKSDGMHLGLQSKIYIGDGMITAPFLWANADVCSKSTINITVPETGYTKDWLPIKTVGGNTDRTQLKNLTFRIDVSKWSELAELQRTNPADHNTRVFPIVTSTQVLCDSSKTDPLLENDECLTRTQFPNLPVDISAKLVLADDGHTVNVQLTKVSPDFPEEPVGPFTPSQDEATYTWQQNLLLGWWHYGNWQCESATDLPYPNSPKATALYTTPDGVSSYWTKANGNVALFNLKFDASAPTIIDIADHTLNASIDPSETTAVSANTDTSKTGGTLTDTSMDTRGHILGLYKSKVTLMGESGTYNFNGLELVTDAEAAYSELVITNTTVNMRGVKCSGSPYSGLYTAMQIPLNAANNKVPQSAKDHNWIRVQAGGKLILGADTMLCMNRAQALNLEADGGEITLPYGVAHVNNPQAYIVRAKNGGKISGFSSGYQVGYASATSTDQAQMMLEADNGEINIGGALTLSGKDMYGEATVHVAGNNGKITANSLALNSSAVANYSTLQFDLPASGWNEAPVQISGAASGSGKATVRVNFSGYKGGGKVIPLVSTTAAISISSYTLATEGDIPEGLTAVLTTIDGGNTLAVSIEKPTIPIDDCITKDEYWTGDSITPPLYLAEDLPLVFGVDYTVKIDDDEITSAEYMPVAVGSYSVEFTGIGGYSGTKTLTWNILRPEYTWEDQASGTWGTAKWRSAAIDAGYSLLWPQLGGHMAYVTKPNAVIDLDGASYPIFGLESKASGVVVKNGTLDFSSSTGHLFHTTADRGTMTFRNMTLKSDNDIWLESKVQWATCTLDRVTLAGAGNWKLRFNPVSSSNTYVLANGDYEFDEFRLETPDPEKFEITEFRRWCTLSISNATIKVSNIYIDMYLDLWLTLGANSTPGGEQPMVDMLSFSKIDYKAEYVLQHLNASAVTKPGTYHIARSCNPMGLVGKYTPQELEYILAQMLAAPPSDPTLSAKIVVTDDDRCLDLIVWKKKVTLDNQGATTPGTEWVTVTYGAAVPTITPPTKTGYTFGGYWTQTGGAGTKYINDDGSSAKNWDLTEPTTLYAKWTANTYTIQRYCQDGTTKMGAPISATYDGEWVTLPIETENPTGMLQNTWDTDKDQWNHLTQGWYKDPDSQAVTQAPKYTSSNRYYYGRCLGRRTLQVKNLTAEQGLEVKLVATYKPVTVTPAPSSFVYDGSPKTPAVTVVVNYTTPVTLTTDDYNVAYANNVNAGTATVTVTGKLGSKYEGMTATAQFTITKKPVTIPTAKTGLMYIGEYQNCIAGYDKNLMTQGENTSCYGLVGDSGVRTPTFTLSDSANYQWSDGTTGVQTVPWHIDPAPITEVTLSAYSATYDGTPHVPSVASLTANEVTYTSFDQGGSYYPPQLKQMYSRDGTSFVEQSGFDFTSAGTIYVKVSGEPRVSGSITRQFTINRKSLDGCSVSINNDWWYPNRVNPGHKPTTVTVKSSTGDVLYNGKVDGQFTCAIYKNEDMSDTPTPTVNVANATYYVTLTGEGVGNFSGTTSTAKAWKLQKVVYELNGVGESSWTTATDWSVKDPAPASYKTDAQQIYPNSPREMFGHDAKIRSRTVTVDGNICVDELTLGVNGGAGATIIGNPEADTDMLQARSIIFAAGSSSSQRNVYTFRNVDFVSENDKDRVALSAQYITIKLEGTNTVQNPALWQFQNSGKDLWLEVCDGSTVIERGLYFYRKDDIGADTNTIRIANAQLYASLTGSTKDAMNVIIDLGEYNRRLFANPSEGLEKTAAPWVASSNIYLGEGSSLTVNAGGLGAGTYPLVRAWGTGSSYHNSLTQGDKGLGWDAAIQNATITVDENLRGVVRKSINAKGEINGVDLVIFHKGLILSFGPAPAQ